LTVQELVQFDNSYMRERIRARLENFKNCAMLARQQRHLHYWIRLKNRWRARNDLFWLAGQLGESFSRIARYQEFYEPFCDEVQLMNQKLLYHNLMVPSVDSNQGNNFPVTEMLLPGEIYEDNGWTKDEMQKIQRLYLGFRTLWKSSIITKLHTIQLIINFPNIHTVLAHNGQETSSDNLESIKNLLRSDPLKTWFPELIPDTKDWGNRSGFSVDNRTDGGRSEDTLEAVGIGTEITGKHWQIAKKNDLVTEDSINTEDQIKKTGDWDDRFNVGLFDDPHMPIQDYEGTRYHFSDLYSKLKGNPRIKLIEIPLEDSEGNPTVACRFSREDIKEIKANTSGWTFSCQHLLKPEDPEKARFKKEFILYWGKIPVGTKNILVVDPASERKKRSDYTVMEVIGLCDDKRFLRYGIRDKLSPTQRIQRAIGLIKEFGIRDILWEAIGFQTTDCFYLEEQRRKEHLVFTIHEIKSHQVAKNDRIFSLIPQYEEGRWLWPDKGTVIENRVFDGRQYDFTEDMEAEALQFPHCEHDDILDAMTFVDRVDLMPGKEVKQIQKTDMTMGEYVELSERHRAQKVMNSRDLRRAVVQYA